MKTNYFKGKKITLMGLGLLDRGVGDAAFLAEQGAELIVTDLKGKEELAESLERLKKYKNISYTLGKHRLEDFRNRDLILKSASVLQDSPYIEEARKNDIRVEMGAAFLIKLLREQGVDVKTIGVTGTRGKSTVVQIIYEILKEDGLSVYLAGNVKGVATLPLIHELKDGDIVVLELDSWQLQGFAEDQISPDIAVFTNFYGDHMDYYHSFDDYFRDKSAIFRFQKGGDTFITLEETFELIKEFSNRLTTSVPKNPVLTNFSDVPSEWNIKIPGTHNLENISLAVAVARSLGVVEEKTKKAVEAFKGMHERLEFVKEVKGVKYYNDNKSTTPEATLVALEALGKKKNLVLIMGGTDKGLDMKILLAAIPQYCKIVILLNETGTERIKKDLQALSGVVVVESNTPREMVEKAASLAEAGDSVLFSPAFASFGKHYKNVYDRGEQFVKLVNELEP